jgi:hypothetical protein
MDTWKLSLLIIALAVGMAAGSGAMWATCRWWYGRKLLAAASRLNKCDQARQFSQQQVMQARRQNELLKAEIASQQQLVADTQSARQRARELEQALLAAEQAVAAVSESSLMPLGNGHGHGFADTQLLP